MQLFGNPRVFLTPTPQHPNTPNLFTNTPPPQGIGFLPQHVKLTNMFEASVRSVNPSVSVPYWDYTKDREELDSIFESSIFSPEMFGSLR